jgi:hypothetical protein
VEWLAFWVTKQIIDKHGGTIRVHSRTSWPRRGTTASILLPTKAAVLLKDDRVITGKSKFAKDSPQNPMSYDEVAKSSRQCGIAISA